MRNSIILLELKYGKTLDDILRKIDSHDYNNLLFIATKNVEDLYPYFKTAYSNDPDLLFSAVVSTVTLTERTFSPTEINFLAETALRGGFGPKLSEHFRTKMSAVIIPKNKSKEINFLKKSLFSFARCLPQESFFSLVEFICCFLLCDGEIESLERSLLLKLFESTHFYS